MASTRITTAGTTTATATATTITMASTRTTAGTRTTTRALATRSEPAAAPQKSKKVSSGDMERINKYSRPNAARLTTSTINDPLAVFRPPGKGEKNSWLTALR